MAQYDIIFFKNDPVTGVSISEFWLSKPAGSNYALSQNPNTGVLYWQLFEPAFAKNNAFNKNFGSIADTVCQGNDSRLSDTRTPAAHAHTFDSITSRPTTLAGYGITDGSSISLGELESNAYRGDRGVVAYNHSQIAHAPSNANYYVHPTNHPPSIITQDASNRFVTDTEKSTWNAKGSSNLILGTASANAYRGDYGNTAYVHSQAAHAPSNANYYLHPANHPPSVITQDASNRFVSDTEKATWNAKGTSNLALGTTSVTAFRGDYGNTAYSHSQAAHAPSDANYYVHPSTHPPSIIAQDANNRFVTDTEKATWNAGGSNAITLGGLALHSARNNEANKVVRTDANGYLQTGYINSSSGDENNYAQPNRVWGTNGSDSYLRTYHTYSLTVGWASGASWANESNYAATAGSVPKAAIEAELTGAITSHSHDYVANSRLNYGIADPTGGSDGDVYFQYE
jgi:hypothetical protein